MICVKWTWPVIIVYVWEFQLQRYRLQNLCNHRENDLLKDVRNLHRQIKI